MTVNSRVAHLQVTTYLQMFIFAFKKKFEKPLLLVINTLPCWVTRSPPPHTYIVTNSVTYLSADVHFCFKQKFEKPLLLVIDTLPCWVTRSPCHYPSPHTQWQTAWPIICRCSFLHLNRSLRSHCCWLSIHFHAGSPGAPYSLSPHTQWQIVWPTYLQIFILTFKQKFVQPLLLVSIHFLAGSPGTP